MFTLAKRHKKKVIQSKDVSVYIHHKLRDSIFYVRAIQSRDMDAIVYMGQ